MGSYELLAVSQPVRIILIVHLRHQNIWDDAIKQSTEDMLEGKVGLTVICNKNRDIARCHDVISGSSA